MNVLKLLGKATVVGFIVILVAIVICLFVATNVYATQYIGDSLLCLFEGKGIIAGTTGYHIGAGTAVVLFWVGFFLYLGIAIDNKKKLSR